MRPIGQAIQETIHQITGREKIIHATTYLDESRPGAFHRLHQKPIPPHGASALAIMGSNGAAEPDNRHGDDHRHENNKKVQESKAGRYGIIDVAVPKHGE